VQPPLEVETPGAAAIGGAICSCGFCGDVVRIGCSMELSLADWGTGGDVAGPSRFTRGCQVPPAESRAVHRLHNLLGPGSGGRRREQRTHASAIVAVRSGDVRVPRRNHAADSTFRVSYS
jgi:hypothetical protein